MVEIVLEQLFTRSEYILEMTVIQYTDHDHFCREDPGFLRWLGSWHEPKHLVDRWVDHEQEIFGNHEPMTPRGLMAQSVATRVSVYLAESVIDPDRSCVDVGCGINWFKNLHPNMWGVDPNPHPGRSAELTPDWWPENWGKWPRVISLNAMHFAPQRDIPQQIDKIRGLLEPGGRGMVTLNRARIREASRRITHEYHESALLETVGQIPGVTKVVWIQSPNDCHIDGNVWLWLQQ